MVEASHRKIPTRRRTASRLTQPPIHNALIEGWVSEEKQRSKFITLWKDKPLITQKCIKSQWFINCGFTIPTLLVEQRVKFFVEM